MSEMDRGESIEKLAGMPLAVVLVVVLEVIGGLLG